MNGSQVLASELEATIAEALEKLDDAAAEARLNEDPIRLHLLALSGFLRAQRQLYADSTASLAQELHEARQPVRDEELQRAVTQGVARYSVGIGRSLERHNLLFAAGMLLAALLIGAGGGWWFGYDAGVTSIPPFNRMTPADAAAWGRLISANQGVGAAALQVCQEHVVRANNGRRACNLPVWLEPPNEVPGVH